MATNSSPPASPLAAIALLLLAAIIPACRQAIVPHPSLRAADSLMDTRPDSALAILSSISSDSLPDAGNRAFFALLITQARYKNMIPLRSDSLSSSAVSYFRYRGNQELYTRALIYEGAALQDMGQPHQAL